MRNPLGFVWRYGLRWRAPESGDDPLVLDALAMGDLVHMTLDRALRTLEANGGLASRDGATDRQRRRWRCRRGRRALGDRTRRAAARDLAAHARRGARAEQACARLWRRAAAWRPCLSARCRSAAPSPSPTSRRPGTPAASVEIPGTGFRIAGYIDRLDISGDGRRALVRDYKTGRQPKDSIVLDGGKELQRCLYAFAVKAMLGEDVAISASLLYPARRGRPAARGSRSAPSSKIAGYLRAARANLLSGGGVLGADTGGTYDDLAFALPANAGATYCKRKIAAATERLGAAAQVWEAP